MLDYSKKFAKLDSEGKVIESSVVNQLPKTYNSSDGIVTGYRNATYRHEQDGWVNVEENITEQNIEIPIPPQIQFAAEKYKAYLEGLFGENAHLNQNLTKETVSLYLVQDETLDLTQKFELEKLYEIITEFNMKVGLNNAAWNFPFGKQSVSRSKQMKTYVVS